MNFWYISVCMSQVALLGQVGLLAILPDNPLDFLTDTLPGDMFDDLLDNITNVLPEDQATFFDGLKEVLPDLTDGHLDDLINVSLSNLVQNVTFQPETLMNTVELVTFYGFPIEVHTVTTKDGYILTLHRIPGNKTHKFDKNLLPIFLVHGTLGNVDSFLSNTPENCFALLLANAGFDVWLANHRGTQYSRGHTYLNPFGAKYWQFSFDEIGKFDMPANVDYILQVTGHPQLYFSGHSIGGGSIPFTFLAERPEYMNKVKAIFALAPSSNFANVSDGLHILVKYEPFLRLFAETFNIFYVPVIPPWVRGFAGKFFESIVQAVVFSLMGPDYQDWNSSRTEVHMAHYFSSTSKYIFIHEAQLIRRNGFRKCDWGASINLQKYGRPTPPDYDISKIDVPSFLYYGENDGFIPKNNAQFLKDRLPNATMIKAGEYWNHLDFLWAKDAARDFYSDLVAFILQFS